MRLFLRLKFLKTVHDIKSKVNYEYSRSGYNKPNSFGNSLHNSGVRTLQAQKGVREDKGIKREGLNGCGFFFGNNPDTLLYNFIFLHPGNKKTKKQ